MVRGQVVSKSLFLIIPLSNPYLSILQAGYIRANHNFKLMPFRKIIPGIFAGLKTRLSSANRWRWCIGISSISQ